MCCTASVIPTGRTVARATGAPFLHRVTSLVAVQILTELLMVETELVGFCPRVALLLGWLSVGRCSCCAHLFDEMHVSPASD